MTLKKFINDLPIFFFLILMVALIYSVVVSGFNYTFDNDEIFNSQATYLIATGNKPHKDFFFIYSPVFHYLLLPIFKIIGFNFNAIIFSRFVMIILFAIRILLSFLLIRTVFGKLAALIFIPLYLFDPFTVFVSMQIRPDNLMLTLFILSLLLFSKKHFILSGAILSLSILTSMKIALTGLAFLIFYGLFILKFRQFKNFFYLLLGIFLPVFAFFLFFAVQGNLFAMIQNVSLDARLTVDSIMFPTPLGFLLLPNNAYIYGLAGKPLNWFYTWALPILGGAGAYQALSRFFKKPKEHKNILKILLFFAFTAAWLTLLFPVTVFAQYHMPINWFFTVFASACIYDFYKEISNFNLPRKLFTTSLVFLFLLLIKDNIQANIQRSKLNFTSQIKKTEARWQQIPENTYVFPNLLFRPLAYPLTTGSFIGDIPKSILQRYPPLEEALEEKKVPYLLLNFFSFSVLTPQTQNYINSHYKRVEGDEELWTRTK